jgi:hypothetical protein
MVEKTPVTPALLYKVAQENRAIDQIGDNLTDGLGWEVGEDMGDMRPEDAARLPISAEAAQQIAASLGAKALTVAQKNANERRHMAKARADRRASGF